MIRSHEHYEALRNLAVALDVADVSKFEGKSITWLEAATRLVASGVLSVTTDGRIVPIGDVMKAPICGDDLLCVFGKIA